MTISFKNALFILFVVFLAATVAPAQTTESLPTTADVIAKMTQFDAQRRSELTGYTAIRRYIAANGKHHAEMFVAVSCASDGSEEFNILSEDGSGWIRDHIFRKLLNEETETSRRGTRDSTRITPENYGFQIIGSDTLATGPAYVLTVAPRIANKYLIEGKIWVDSKDFSIVRIEGQPARNPSFWIRSVGIVRTYQRVGPFWFAASTDTISQIRILGRSELTIENSNYTLDPPKDGAAEVSETVR
jgi:hypothetical protein